MARITKIMLTGACGSLGTVLRPALAAICDELLSVDIVEAPECLPNETYVRCDVSDMEAFAPLCEGVEMIVHFAGIPDERDFPTLLGPSFIASYNVWEAGYRAGVRRVIYASSVHAVGMARTADVIGVDAPHQPDTFYGLSKCFTEDLGRLYWDKRGMESVHCRIFSCTAEPQNVRALATWLSHGDLCRMVVAAVRAHTVGFSVVYGVSANDRAPVSNAGAAHLGYVPQDNAEAWAEQLMAAAPKADPQDPAQMCLGGPFATVPLGESGVAGIKAMSKGDD